MNRIANGACFSAAKKAKMELTIRTPYRTILDKFEGFSRIVAKTNEAALIIQNRTPAAVYILPPGPLKIKFTQDVKGVTGDFLHLGGYVFVNPDNTCEINLMDVVDRKEAKVDQFDKSDVKDADTVAGRYAGKIRRSAQRTFIKKQQHDIITQNKQIHLQDALKSKGYSLFNRYKQILFICH